MFSQSVRNVMEPKKLLTAPPQLTISAASKRMADRNVGALLVVEDNKLLGIFTERDALFRVIAKGRNPTTTRLDEVMTPEPQTVSPGKSFGYALLVMHEGGFRHLPVLEQGRLVGIVSARNALDPELGEFVAESERRRQYKLETT